MSFIKGVDLQMMIQQSAHVSRESSQQVRKTEATAQDAQMRIQFELAQERIEEMEETEDSRIIRDDDESRALPEEKKKRKKSEEEEANRELEMEMDEQSAYYLASHSLGDESQRRAQITTAKAHGEMSPDHIDLKI